MAARNYGQYCGVVTALELIGERWALLIVRDLLVGPRRYSDLKAGIPRIPTNILSTRLKELQQTGVVRRLPMAHGLAYALTEYGQGLEDVVLALGRWGFQAMGEPSDSDIVTSDSMTIAFRTAYQADVAAQFPTTGYEVHIGDIALGVRTGAAGLLVAPVPGSLGVPGSSGIPACAGLEPLARGAELSFAAGPGIRALISGEITPEDAIRSEVVHIITGEAALLDRFAVTFHLDPVMTPAR